MQESQGKTASFKSINAETHKTSKDYLREIALSLMSIDVTLRALTGLLLTREQQGEQKEKQ